MRADTFGPKPDGKKDTTGIARADCPLSFLLTAITIKV